MAEYNYWNHWNALRQSRSGQAVLWVGSAISAASTAREQLTGTTYRFKDLLDKLPGSPWMWCSVTLGFLVVVLFHETKSIIQKNLDERIKEADSAAIKHKEGAEREEALKAALIDAKATVSAQELSLSQLKRDLTESLSKIGRPHIKLTWGEVVYKDGAGETISPPIEERTEIVATCIDHDVWGVVIHPAMLGSFELQPKEPIPSLAPGESGRLQYRLGKGDGQRNISLLGHLSELLETLAAEPGREGGLRVPIMITYLDVHRREWRDHFELFYLPGVFGGPIFEPVQAATDWDLGHRPPR